MFDFQNTLKTYFNHIMLLLVLYILIVSLLQFTDVSVIAVSKTPEHQKVDTGKSRWNQWSPLAALTTKSEKKRTQDDAALSVSIHILERKWDSYSTYF